MVLKITPDEMDASDIIDNLKSCGTSLEEPDVNVCKAHTQALIFIIRRLDFAPHNVYELVLSLFRASPLALLAIALLVLILRVT